MPEFNVDSAWLTETLESLDSMVNSVANLTDFFSQLQNFTDLESIIEFLPDIQKFFVNSGPETLYKE